MGISPELAKELAESRTEIARRVDSKRFSEIFGKPWWLDVPRDAREKAQREREVYEAFESAVCNLIEQGVLPTAARLASELGVTEAEADTWLAGYTKSRLGRQEQLEQERVRQGTRAQEAVNTATKRLRDAEAALERARDAKQLPMPNLDDPNLSDSDPFVATLRTAKAHYDATLAQFGYQAELSRTPGYAQIVGQNRDSRRAQLAAAVAGITDAMKNYDQTLTGTKKLEEQLARVQRQIAESRQREQVTHANIIRQHAEYWRLTGELMRDYAIPPKPRAEADASDQKVKPVAKR